MHKEIVESEESHCDSSSRNDRRLCFPVTICLCSPHGHHCSKVGHWFRSVTPYVQWPQQLLNIPKAFTSYLNQARRQHFSHRHISRFWRCPSGLRSRSPPYSYFSTFPSMDHPIGFGWAYDYISKRTMLYNFAIFLYPSWKTNQQNIYHSSRNHTSIIDYQELEKEKERLLTSKSTNHRAYNRT